jgi:hypothetical protein
VKQANPAPRKSTKKDPKIWGKNDGKLQKSLKIGHFSAAPFLGIISAAMMIAMKAKVLTPPQPLKSNELLAVSYIGDAAAYADAGSQLFNFQRSGPV